MIKYLKDVQKGIIKIVPKIDMSLFTIDELNKMVEIGRRTDDKAENLTVDDKIYLGELTKVYNIRLDDRKNQIACLKN
jgi:hypothetical protein